MPEKYILVTSAAGFIGAHFILDWLENESAGIVNLDKLTYALIDGILSGTVLICWGCPSIGMLDGSVRKEFNHE